MCYFQKTSKDSTVLVDQVRGQRHYVNSVRNRDKDTEVKILEEILLSGETPQVIQSKKVDRTYYYTGHRTTLKPYGVDPGETKSRTPYR